VRDQRFVLEVDSSPVAWLHAPAVCDPMRLDWESFFAALDVALARDTRFAMILDFRRTGRPDAARRRRFAAWLTKHEARVRDRVVGSAQVVDNELQRAALTATLWLIGTPVPMRAFSDIDEARAWARSQLGAEARARM